MEKIVKNGITAVCMLLAAVIMMLAYMFSGRSMLMQCVTAVVVSVDVLIAIICLKRMND